MNERVIFHCDANSFFASVEVANNPELKNKPVAVSGNPKTRTGIILTKNEVAKKYGVQTGEVIWQAKLKCPNLVCLPPHHKVYEQYSKKLRAIYEKYTDKVEAFGVDECWLDVTDTLKFFGDKIALADRIRNEVRETLGITISVGISFGKLLAKLGSDLKKPDATTVLDYSNYKKIVYPMPVNSIIGVGRKLTLRFNKLGVFTLGDITRLPDNILKKKFGIIGLDIKQKLLGNDFEPVRNCEDIAPPKSIGNGTTTIKDIYSRQEIKDVVIALCEEVASRLRSQNFNASSLSVTLKTAEFKYFHDTIRLDHPTNSALNLSTFAMQVVDGIWEYNTAVRAIRICSYNLSKTTNSQICMFDNLKNSSLNACLDSLRKKYGYYALAPANLICPTTLDLSKVEV